MAALKQPSAPTPPVQTMQSMPPGPNSYYPPPQQPATFQGSANHYTSTVQQPPHAPNALPQSLGSPPTNPALANLPPNILALLQSAQQQQQQRPPVPGQGYGMAPPPPHLMNTLTPPPGAMGAPGNNPQYQQLMAYLVRTNSLEKDVFTYHFLQQSQAATQAANGKP